MFDFKIGRTAEKFLEHLKKDKKLLKLMHNKITSLAANPMPTGCKKLRDNYYRIRIGDYRIIYGVFHENNIVYVAAIGHRREIYRSLPYN